MVTMLQWTQQRLYRPRSFVSIALFALAIAVSNMVMFRYMHGSLIHNVLVSDDIVAPASSFSQGTFAKNKDKATVKAITDSIVVDVTRVQPIPVQTFAIPSALITSIKTSLKSNTKKFKTLATRAMFRNPNQNAFSSSVNALTPDCGDIKFRTHDKNLVYFKPALSGRNLCILVETMDAFTAALASTNISYFMYGGTLLGSWRHHGLIPWDDDMDFAVPLDQKQSVYRLLMDLKPKFILVVKQKKRWKMFHVKAHPIRGVSWKFPFLDINFYQENSTHVWDYDASFKMFTFPREWVFPLKLRPFHGRMLWAPRQPEKFLRQTYKLEQCATAVFSHRAETPIPLAERRTAACTKLHSVLPFVKHTPATNGCNETLEQNGQILRCFLDSTGC